TNVVYYQAQDHATTDQFSYVLVNHVDISSAPAMVSLAITPYGGLAGYGDSAITAEDTPISIDVLANDFYKGAPLPNNGSIIPTLVPPDGTFKGALSVVGRQILYTPPANYNDV